MPALQEATTEMLPDSTLERVAEIAQCSQRLEIVHDGDQHDDRANEGNDSTQVAAEQDYICCSSQRFFFFIECWCCQCTIWVLVGAVAWFGKHVRLQACGLVLFSYEPISDCTDPFETIVNWMGRERYDLVFSQQPTPKTHRKLGG